MKRSSGRVAGNPSRLTRTRGVHPRAMGITREHLLMVTVFPLGAGDLVGHHLHRFAVRISLLTPCCPVPPTMVTGAARCRRLRARAHLRVRSHDTVTRAHEASARWQRAYRAEVGGHRPRPRVRADVTRPTEIMGNSRLSPRMSKVCFKWLLFLTCTLIRLISSYVWCTLGVGPAAASTTPEPGRRHLWSTSLTQASDSQTQRSQTRHHLRAARCTSEACCSSTP